MKRSLTLAALCIFVIFMYSCHKDGAGPSGPAPVKVDLTEKVTCSVSGYITNESGDPVVFANVTAGSKQILTDRYGYFSLQGVSLPEVAGFVKVTSNGYFNGYRTFLPQKDKETVVRIGLLTKKDIGAVDAVAGGEATTTDGGKVVLPANGVVNAVGGTTYTGQVHINARWLDPTDAGSQQTGLPGDGRGTDKDGYLKALKSYGIMAVELTGASGQALQIAPGKTASVYIPVPSSLSSTAPATIALWSFNDSLGLWKQEGTATKTGNTYCGTTSHFSFWDGAEGFSLVNFKAKVVDAAAHPLANVPVSITVAGVPLNVGYGRFGYTDAEGNVTGAVFANYNLVFQVMTPCATVAYSQPFSTNSADVDLGQVTGNMGQSIVTISGTVANCEKQPVTNGYVQTYDHGFYNRIPIVNGAFSYTGVACTNLAVNVVAIDNATNRQGEPKIVTLTAGANDLGALTACGTSTMGNMSFTIDGVTTSLIEPTDTLGGYFLTPVADNPARWTQIVTLSGNPNQTQQMAFQFDGDNVAGNDHHVTDLFSVKFPGGRAYWPVPIVVNITEYGPIGGFISGSFTNQLIDFSDNGLHTFSCSFRIRRYN